MELSNLTAISPVDGRYRGKCEPLADYFSEYAIIRYRVKVEIEYFIALSEAGLPQLPALAPDTVEALRRIYEPDVFTPEEAEKIKTIEQTTNHDVKAVEYYLKEQFDALGLADSKEFI
ncbi:MAG: adenylosuccinate lyase, partial [Muribaculaceae bacterium]|nr:adenylosuccinate lyase [Muribaculaceae bacterium]